MDFDEVTGENVDDQWIRERNARRLEGPSYTCHLENRINKFGEPC